MFGLFAGLTLVWAAVLARGRADGTAQRIHWLMLALAAAKSATLFTEALMTSHVEATGSADGWDVAFFVSTFLRGLLFFVVLVLIGTGWSYMKPFIDDNTKRVLLVVVPAQVWDVCCVFGVVVGGFCRPCGCFCVRQGLSTPDPASRFESNRAKHHLSPPQPRLDKKQHH
jgi:hypothetical protein